MTPFTQGPIHSNDDAIRAAPYEDSTHSNKMGPGLAESAQEPTQGDGISVGQFQRSTHLSMAHKIASHINDLTTPTRQTPSGDALDYSMEFSPMKLDKFQRTGLLHHSQAKLQAPDTQEPSMDEVYPSLYVGAKECFSEHFLRKHGITAVVTVMKQPILDKENTSLNIMIPLKYRLFLRADDTWTQTCCSICLVLVLSSKRDW